MNNILLLTPVYPGHNVHKSTTPVVHYFVREWVKMGYNVRVIHFPVNFPSIVYSISKPFKERLSSIMGSEIRTWPLCDCEYEYENVKVRRIPLTKFLPHTRYSNRQIIMAINKTISYCQSEDFTPDVIVAHWVNPSLEIMHYLKKHYQVPICFVSHDVGWDLKSIYKKEARQLIEETDVIGYRSDYIRRTFELDFDCAHKKSFMCYSGIPQSYIRNDYRTFNCIRSFIFVGTLLKRKYPAQIIPAINNAFSNKDYVINFVGLGEECKTIECIAKELNIERNIKMLGFVERDKVVEILDKSDVFVMISKNETFGLVYLEAMARGCITIASRCEGFDGIIKDGFNGFLCAAGNSKELEQILNKIKQMSPSKLSEISKNAVDTAKSLTDTLAATKYLNNIMCPSEAQS